jgi:hypothetical protein
MKSGSAPSVITTQGGRTRKDNKGVTFYQCTVAGCSQSYKTPVGLPDI